MPNIIIRPFELCDVGALLVLMRDLAAFEGYLDAFAVKETDLIQFGLGPHPKFQALVADDKTTLCGMAVTYTVPWAYDMRPRVVLKELYVRDGYRGQGIGKALMLAVQNQARDIGASQINWTVLKGNRRAEAFYAQLGGQPDPVWNNWVMPI